VALVVVLILAGCGKPLDPAPTARAEAAVDQVLDAWSRGEAADLHAGPGRPVRITDPDWKAGYRLLSFLTVQAQPVADQPDKVRCRVALSLKDPRGKAVNKEVTYEIQVAETVVVNRVGP
jgi:hypothetical protein